MAQLTPYARNYSFQDFQTGHPSTPLPGDKVNAELDAIAASTVQFRDRIARLQRDDLALANDSVGYDQLRDEVVIGFNAPSTWATATEYAARDTVFTASKFYVALEAHTSGTFATDLAAGLWEIVADFTSATTAAQTAQAAAELAETNAETAQAAAEAAKAQAITSAANAATSENNASGSSASADAFASAAAGSASDSAASATASGVSAAAALVSETNAAASEAAAELAASSVELPTPAASTFLRRNAGNTAYETLTTEESANLSTLASTLSAPRINSRTSGGTVNLSGFEEVIVNRWDNSAPLAPALYKQAEAEPSHAGKFQDSSGTWFEIAEPVLTERMFGSPCDGEFDAATEVGTDATTNIQNWLDCIVSNRKKFTGVSRITAGVTFPVDTILEGDGFHTGLTGRQIASLTETELLGCAGDDFTAISELGANVAEGDNILTLVDTTGLKAGDWILIQNPTASSFVTVGSRTTYRAGEWVRVYRVVDGTTIHTYGPTCAAYTVADVDLYLNRNGTAQLRNFRVEAPDLDNKAAVRIDKLISPVVEHIKATGTQHSNVSVRRCLDPYINLRDGFEGYDATSDNEYDLSIGACTGGTILGEYYAQRHGISFGNGDYIGNVPNRGTIIMANTHGAFGAPSLDVGGHGCSEGLVVIGGTHDGLVTGGKNMRFIGAKFRKGSGADAIGGGLSLQGSEFAGGEFVFDNCEFEQLASNASTLCMFALSLPAEDGEPVRFYFNNCIFKPHADTTQLFRLQNQNMPHAPAVYINGGRVIGGTSLTQVIRAQRLTTSGTAASNFEACVVRDLEGLNDTALRSAVVNAGTSLTIDRTIMPPIVVSTTFDPASIAAGGVLTTDITTTGLVAAGLWYCEPRFSLQTAGLHLTAWIVNTTTVRVSFFNPTAGAIDLASGTLSVTIQRD